MIGRMWVTADLCQKLKKKQKNIITVKEEEVYFCTTDWILKRSEIETKH